MTHGSLYTDTVSESSKLQGRKSDQLKLWNVLQLELYIEFVVNQLIHFTLTLLLVFNSILNWNITGSTLQDSEFRFHLYVTAESTFRSLWHQLHVTCYQFWYWRSFFEVGSANTFIFQNFILRVLQNFTSFTNDAWSQVANLIAAVFESSLAQR